MRGGPRPSPSAATCTWASRPPKARATAEVVVARGYRGFPREALVIGSVDEVVAQLRPLAGLGYTDVIVRHLTDDQPKVLGSMARLAEVRRALA